MIRPQGKSAPDTRASRSGQSVVEFALVAPLLLILLVAIVDFARVYTTVMSVESSAREAADYGTTLGAAKWQSGAPLDANVAEMRKRACVAASNLPEYVGPDATCTNPTFSYCVTPDDGDPLTNETCGPVNPADGCDNPLRATPCKVTTTVTYEFRLLAPVSVELQGVNFGLPTSITFVRDSTFAVTDIDVAAP